MIIISDTSKLNHERNLTRALEITRTNPSAHGVKIEHYRLDVGEVVLNLDNDDDRMVAAILMANDEYGFALSFINQTYEDLRRLQRQWG